MEEKIIISAEKAKQAKEARARKRQEKKERKIDKAVNETAKWLIKLLVKSDEDYIKVRQARLSRKLGSYGYIPNLSMFLENEGYAAYAEKQGKYFYLSTDEDAISDFIADDSDLNEGFDYFDEEED